MLKTYLQDNNYEYEENASLKKYNTYRINSQEKYLVFPKTIEELTNLLQVLKDNNIDFTILGGGSNIIFAKQYYDRVFINLAKLNHLSIEDNILTAGAGVGLIKAANYAIGEGYDGLVFATGVPGTIGGAAVVNAGCYGSSMSEVVNKVTVLKEDLTIAEMTNEEMLDFVKETKLYVYNNFNLNGMTDAELEEAVENLIEKQVEDIYIPLEQKALIVQQIYSSIL